MHWTVVKKRGCFSTFCAKPLVKLADPFLKYPSKRRFCVLYKHGKLFIFLKQQGFFDFPITSIGGFSHVALAANIAVSLTLLLFPPEHFWPLKW